MSEYDVPGPSPRAKARAFLDRFHLKLFILKVPYTMPAWAARDADVGDERGQRHKYKITLRKGEPGVDCQELSFPFWDSIANFGVGKQPTAYDVLACISLDALSPTDPDEVVDEFGEMKPSQAIAVAEFAKKLQAFFTRDELKALGEIQ